jgi:transmembrane sensor
MDIHELIIRAARGAADERDLATLEAWRNADPEHEREYQELLALARAARSLGQELNSTPPGAQEIVSRAERLVGSSSSPVPGQTGSSSPTSSPFRWRPALGPLTAAAAFVLLTFGLIRLGGDFLPTVTPPDPLVTVATQTNEKQTVRLDDGTVIHLAGGSSLEVVDQGTQMDIWLVGKAFLAVRPGSERPTVVHTPAGEAVVLGTRFEVSSQGDELRLLVVEGRVGLKSAYGEVEVNRGQLSVMRSGAVESLESVPEPLELLDWMGGTLVFQETPLSEVAREIRWHYGVKVRLMDEELSTRTLTTVFDGQPLETVMAVICRTVQAQCQVKEDRILLSPAQEGTPSFQERPGSPSAPAARTVAPPEH